MSALAGTGGSDDQNAVGRQRMGPVDLDDRLDDALLDALHPVKLLIKDTAGLHRIDRFKIIALPANIQHDR